MVGWMGEGGKGRDEWMDGRGRDRWMGEWIDGMEGLCGWMDDNLGG